MFGLLLFFLWAALTLPNAWRETRLREAYLPQLEQQARQDSDNGPLLALTGARLQEAGENTAAADMLRRALASGEDKEINWQMLAACVAATGDRTRAVADLRLGIKALPSSTRLQGALAQARIADPGTPPPLLARAICPDGAAPLLQTYAAGSFLNGLAEWWGRHHPEDSGFATRQAWAAERPGDAEAQRLWGEALLQNRRFSEAETVLALAHSLAPQSPAVTLALADCYAQAGNSPKAALQYLACLKLRPDWLPALLGFGRASLKNALVPYAISAFTRGTQVVPASDEAWIGLGQSQLKTGVAFDLAVAAFQTAGRLSPARTDYFNDYADALRRSGHAPEAEALLRRRLQSAPDDALSHYLLGLILHDTNPTPARVDEAEAETRESLRLSPNNPLPTTLLGQILQEKGQFGPALVLLQDALAHTPYDQKLLLLLARAYQQSGQTVKAAQISARAKALFDDQQRAAVLTDQEHKNPLDISLHRQLVVLYARNGQPAKAQHEADMVHLLQTDPKRALQAMDDLDTQIQAVIPKK